MFGERRGLRARQRTIAALVTVIVAAIAAAACKHEAASKIARARATHRSPRDDGRGRSRRLQKVRDDERRRRRRRRARKSEQNKNAARQLAIALMMA